MNTRLVMINFGSLTYFFWARNALISASCRSPGRWLMVEKYCTSVRLGFVGVTLMAWLLPGASMWSGSSGRLLGVAGVVVGSVRLEVSVLDPGILGWSLRLARCWVVDGGEASFLRRARGLSLEDVSAHLKLSCLRRYPWWISPHFGQSRSVVSCLP